MIESALVCLSAKERDVTLAILYHLIELDRRGFYRELGYSSLFDYCTRKLLYSEASAQRRITAARCLADFPELEPHFLLGQVNLSTISLAASSLRANKTQVIDIVGKSSREVQSLVLAEEVALKPKERIRPVIVTPSRAPLLPEPQREERVSFQFSVPKGVYEQFTQAKSLLSHSIGRELSAEAVFSKLLERFLSKPRAYRRRSLRARCIPKSLKHEVYTRDGYRCCFEANGMRCSATLHLEIDHIIPFARGGRTELSNLRLLCPAHNRLYAERCFGREFVASKISLEVSREN